MSLQSTQLMKDANVDQRNLRFRRLNRRNNVVMVLRVAVPGIGMLVAGLLIFQIILTNLASDYGISGLRVEQDQVVIDEPRYTGITPDGTTYSILASVARVDIGSTDIINLENATIKIQQSDGYEMFAEAPEAQLDLGGQLISVKGVMYTKDSDQVVGEFHDSVINWKAQTLVTKGQVKIEFSDGATIEAQSLVYTASNLQWDFGPVIYTILGDGGL